ncbi:MAG: shikimate dehydrogenase [Acidimicrobiales bacterium]
MTGPGVGTAVAAVIGSPVRHSRSPSIHNAAFAATGLDWVYLAFDVAEQSAGAAVRGAQALGFRGLSVTMPLKAAILPALDEISHAAAALEAVNTVSFEDGRACGDNTDGAGFLRSLVAATGRDASGRDVVVIGAGGAARAVALALGQAGAASVGILNRDAGRAARAATLAGSVGRVAVPGDVAAADLVVNATPVGMAGTEGADRLAVAADLLRPGQVVVDLVYHPLETPLLAAARHAGAVPVDGLGMLVQQAALQFERWTGVDAPVAAMDRAARTG